MLAELQLRDYLENSTEASKRIRTIVTILVVVTVLILAGFLNSWHGYAWNRQRIGFQADYLKQLNARIEQFTQAQKQLATGANDFTPLKANLPSLLQTLSPRYGSEACENLPDKVASKEKGEEALNGSIRCYEGAQKLSEAFLNETIKSYVENAYFVRVPFFGVAFDINDLGAIGGLSLIVILLMLRLNLRNFIVSLRIGFKAARNANRYEQFYEILAGRQLFAFPDLEDAKQDLYEGRTEAIWKKSRAKGWFELTAKGFSASFSRIKNAFWTLLTIVLRSTYNESATNVEQIDSPESNGASPNLNQAEASNQIQATVENKITGLLKNDAVNVKKTQENGSKQGWYSNRHPLLALVPTWICLVPAIVYGGVVVNDFMSYQVGLVVNRTRTMTSFGFSLFCLLVIFGLGCWCVSKWIEIDQLWTLFSGPTKGHSSQGQPRELNASDGDNAKPVTPVVSPA